MEAEPIHYPDHDQIYQWSGGVEGINYCPELLAIYNLAKRLKEKPPYFKVEEKIYCLSDFTWGRIKQCPTI